MSLEQKIKVPTDASINVQAAVRDIKDCLKTIEERLSTRKPEVTADDVDQLRREIQRLTKKPTFQTWGDVFGTIKDFSFSSAPQSLDPDISGQPFRHFTFEGVDLNYCQVSAGATAAGTANPVGVYAVHNRGISAAEKRIAMLVGNTDGAQDSGNLELWVMAGGVAVPRVRLMSNGTLLVNYQGPIATNATGGFLAIPQCAGAPSGVPAGLPAAGASTLFDSTNNKLWCYNTVAAAWKGVVLS